MELSDPQILADSVTEWVNDAQGRRGHEKIVCDSSDCAVHLPGRQPGWFFGPVPRSMQLQMGQWQTRGRLHKCRLHSRSHSPSPWDPNTANEWQLRQKVGERCLQERGTFEPSTDLYEQLPCSGKISLPTVALVPPFVYWLKSCWVGKVWVYLCQIGAPN